MVRSPDWMKPRGSVRKARYQPRVLTLQDRTKTRLSTTTTQMPMNRCVAPALILRLLPSRRAVTMSAEKRRGSGIRTFFGCAIEKVHHARPQTVLGTDDQQSVAFNEAFEKG